VSRPYKITSFDTTIADIAQRFHIGGGELGPFIIINMNPAILASISPFGQLTMDKVGQIIQLPDDPTPDDVDWEWEPYVSSGTETLQSICDSHNKDKRIDPSGRGSGIPSPPFLTPQSLLDMYRNADVRGAHGGDASGVSLAKGEVLLIPFPRPPAHKQALEVTPQGKTKVLLDPPWLTELRNFYESIRQRTRFFEVDLGRIRALQRRGLLEVDVLHPLKEVLRMTIEHPSVPKELKPNEIASLKAIDQVLDDFGNTAMDTMHQRVFEILRNSEMQDIVARGKQLLADLRDPHFDELTKKLTGERALHPRAMNELCDVLGYAYSILEDSFLADDAATDIGGVTAFLAGGRPVKGDPFRQVDPALADAIAQVPAAPPPGGALGTIVQALAVANATAGNIRDIVLPSSLMVSLVRLEVVRAAKAFADAFGNNGMSATAQAQLQAKAWKVIMRLASSPLQEDDLIKLGEAVRAIDDPKMFPDTVADTLQVIDDAISGHSQASARWVAGVRLVNLIAFVLAGYDVLKNGLNLQNGVSGFASFAGFAATMTPWATTKLLQWGVIGARTATTAGRVMGLTAGGVGVGVGLFQTVQAVRADDTGGTVLNGVGTLGSTLLVIAMFPSPLSIPLAVTGGILVVGTGAISAVEALSSLTADDWKDINPTSSQQSVWWRHQERHFERGDICKQVLAVQPALATKAAAFRRAIDDASFLLIDTSQKDALFKLVPDDESRQALMAS
jgi:hypothetical protein